MKKDEHKGQVALVLVLIMTVVSALAVSLASRSTVDTRIQQSESLGVQALLFAQTGLEQLIMNPAPTSGAPGTNYYAVMSAVGSDNLEVGLMETGSLVEVSLEPTNPALTGFTVYWGPGDFGGQPAVFISLVESSGKITDYAYDYGGSNGFTAASVGSEGYAKSTGAIGLISTVVKVRIMVLGAPALLKVLPVGAGAVFPSQIISIKSIGSVQSDNKTVKYGLRYDESAVESVPSVFDYALFSGGSIIQ